jgi:FlaA1/EpsC-like NDP-sugar epimerase
MTIPEACQLVLEAGFMGKGGEIFVFDMGEPVKIYDLAAKMISLSGFVPNKDIDIEITGLRPGEKLYEELLDNKEEVLRNTFNDKIMIGKDRKHDLTIVNDKIVDLLKGLDDLSRNRLVEKMMDIVPEFISTNSYYGDGKKGKLAKNVNLTEPVLKTNSALIKDKNGVKKEFEEQELHLK